MSTKTPSAVVSFNAVPEDAADPDVKVYVNGELVESGGGGGGDLSTCKVTFDADSSTGSLKLPNYIEDCATGSFSVSANSEANAILYKGAAIIEKTNPADILTVVSGSAEVNDDGTVSVTGDCVINYTSEIW